MNLLTIDRARGVAWQTDLTPSCYYGPAYFDRYRKMDATPMGAALTLLRLDLVERHFPPDGGKLIDVGIGGGAFLRAARRRGIPARGHDVNPMAIDWLLLRQLLGDPYQDPVDAHTLWDVFEHLPHPDAILAAVRPGKLLFLSLPICPDLNELRTWKHYRPGEHLWYWTRAGFASWIQDRGFSVLECNDLETRDGREDILSYALQKSRR